ncbi:MAG: sensor histidine kinase [Gemmatimonadaceae bacterium]
MRLPFRPATAWPRLLLLVSLALTTLGVLEAARSTRANQRLAEHAVRDYAGFAAWSYQQHLRVTLDAAVREALGAVNHDPYVHERPPVPPAWDLAHYLPFDRRCNCHRPRRGPVPAIYFAFELGSDTLATGQNAHDDPIVGWEVDRPPSELAMLRRRPDYTAAERAWVNDTITRQVRAPGNPGRFPLIVAERGGVTRVLAYTRMPTAWGDTLIYGVEYDEDRFRALLADVMYDGTLLPTAFTRGRPARELLQLRVTTASGAALYASDSVERWTLDDSGRMETPYAGLVVRAQIRPDEAGSVLIGGVPRSRLPFLLGLLALGGALAVVAVAQVRREGELAQLRSSFVASISHELRTPIAQMRLYLETLRLGRYPTEAARARAVDHVERETLRLGQLVERVLRFSRTGRARGEDAEPVALGEETARLVDEFAPLAEAARSRVTLERPAEELYAALRPEALRHVLLNLLDNAIKYGPKGQVVRVTLSALGPRPSAAGALVRIEVQDEGSGVPVAERETIWRPYQRGSTSRHSAGSGIGLSVVADVVAEHGGRCGVEAAPGGTGALFWVELPALLRSNEGRGPRTEGPL